MKLINKSGPLIVFTLVIIPALLWLPYSRWNNIFSIYRSLGQLSALMGATLFCINFILSARFRLIENLFFGLNKVFINHHLFGIYALILLLAHPSLLFLSYLKFSFNTALKFITPSLTDLPQLYGLLALTTIVILLFLTLYVKLHYETWKATHQFMGLALFLGFMHVFFIQSTISRVIPLRIYMLSFFVLGSISYVYRMLVKYFRFTSLPHTVLRVNKIKDCVEIVLEPDRKSVRFVPGQFVFISIDQFGIRRESHPFSITSSPDKKTLSVISKNVGDYTKSLQVLTPGSKVFVEGPWGRFSYQYYKKRKQIWIAGGIGITPFIGMSKSIPVDYDVTLYYLVHDKSEMIFDNFAKNIKLNIYESAKDGHFEAKDIKVKNLNEYEIFICGPIPMMKSLKSQLRQIGVKSSQIHTEEFSLN